MDVTSSLASSVGWKTIESLLPPGFRAMAEELCLVRPMPPHLGAKIDDVAVLLRLQLYRVGTGASLKVTVSTAAAGAVADISHVALHKWEKKSGRYLAMLGAQMIEADAAFGSARWAGYEVISADATTVQRPGSFGTTARVHYAMRLSDLALMHGEATDAKGGETLRRFDLQQGQLWLVDRCYANPPGLAYAKARGAEVIVRLNRGTLPLFDRNGAAFDVMRKLRSLKGVGRIGEWQLRAESKAGDSVDGRLCAVRLPHDKAKQARKRLREEYGSEVSAEMLEAADFLAVFTTVPNEKLSAEQILELYRLRWQIEIEIKREKSIGGLDKLPNFRADTIHAWICGHLLLQSIARRLATTTSSFSPGEVACALLGAPRAYPTPGADHESHLAGDDPCLAGVARRAAPRSHRAVA